MGIVRDTSAMTTPFGENFFEGVGDGYIVSQIDLHYYVSGVSDMYECSASFSFTNYPQIVICLFILVFVDKPEQEKARAYGGYEYIQSSIVMNFRHLMMMMISLATNPDW